MSTANKYKPNNSKFHQQQLPACTPVITVRNAYPFCLIVGALFVCLGGWFLSVSRSVEEVVVPYTHCTDSESRLCSEVVKDASFYKDYKYCRCSVSFTLQNDIAGPVYFYYGLTNFYQNHRRYVRSRDDNQLNGQTGSLSSDCAPYQYQNDSGVMKPIVPCGAVAMSIFNDTFSLISPSNSPVDWSRSNISWASDRQVKFGKVTDAMLKDSVKPASWPKDALARNPSAFSGDEDLIVWMRTAALPTFRKLYAIINGGLKAGTYTINIAYAYPVTQFDGTKRVIVTQNSWLGGRNDAMGIAYIVVGVIHLVLGGIFLLIDLHLIRKRNNRAR